MGPTVKFGLGEKEIVRSPGMLPTHETKKGGAKPEPWDKKGV